MITQIAITALSEITPEDFFEGAIRWCEERIGPVFINGREYKGYQLITGDPKSNTYRLLGRKSYWR